MKFKLALLAAAGSLALASGASAQEDQGYYGTLGFGYTFSNDSNDFEDTGDAEPASFVTDYDLDEAYGLYGAFGKYHDGTNFRGELELSTRSQEIDELPGDGLGFAGFASDGNIGDVTLTTLMANVYYDFEGVSQYVTPYLGVGAGAGFFRAEADNSDITGPAAVPSEPYLIVMGDKDVTPAAQFLAGLSFDVAENLDATLGYRYILTSTLEYGAALNAQSNPDVTGIEAGFDAQEVTAGLRWNFGGPAPVVEEQPAPPPVTYKDCWDGSRVESTAQCPPEPVEETEVAPEDLSLTVYFDFDKSNLTEAAQDLIAARSAEALEYDISRVNVEGNTDTSGSAAYNNRLSARRAEVVEQSLIANGIDQSLITSEALGETNPARETGDGVREPLNRRTEVMFQF